MPTTTVIKTSRIHTYLKSHEGISPLVVFRFVFGSMMAFAILRFWLNGWIETQYLDPVFFFSYQAFEWVKPLGNPAIYILYASCGIAALFIAVGFLYRFSTLFFFLSFTYIELMDKTNYLNHYYFVTLIAFLMIWLPAHRAHSVDAKIGLAKPSATAPRFFRHLLLFQLAVVYFFAGLAKLNSDWLLAAQPMTTWLKAFGHFPVVGSFFDSHLAAYGFSWVGALYDLSIPFLLFFNRTRPWAYLAVIVFHTITAILFPIGMFPFVMIGATLIFFPPSFHDKLLKMVGLKAKNTPKTQLGLSKPALYGAVIFAVIQLLVPFRHLANDGELFWYENGYRFSWRVMLMEKAGAAFFYVQDGNEGRAMEIRNSDYLTPNQEKMMATQPDMILEYAHFLEEEFKTLGMEDPVVKAKVYVTLNGRPSRPFVNPEIDLTDKKQINTNQWLVPFEDEIHGL